MLSFWLEHASAVAGARIAEIPFPAAAAALLIVRDDQLVAPHGDTVLAAGDHIFIFCRPEDRATIDLLFGNEAE